MKGYFRRLSFKWKTALVLAVSNLLALLLVLLAILVFEGINLPRQGRGELEALGNSLNVTLHGPMNFRDEEEATRTLQTLEGVPDVLEAHLYLPGGRPFAHYWREDQARAIPELAGPEGFSGEGGGLRLVKMLTLEGEPYGYLVVKSDLGMARRRFGEVVGLLSALALFWVLASLGFAYFLQTSITRPVLALAEVADRVGRKGDFSARAQVESADEVGRLTASFNAMLEAVQVRDLALEERGRRLQEELTERRRAEAEAVAGEENLRRIIETSPVAMAVIRKDGTIEFLNATFTALLGYTLADCPRLEVFLARALAEPEEAEKGTGRWLQAGGQGGEGEPWKRGAVDLKLRTKGGETRIMSAITSALGDRRLVVLMDFSERYEAEQRLLEEKLFSDAVIGNLPGLFFLMEEGGWITRVNKVGEEFLGQLEEAETHGPRRLRMAILPRDQEVAEEFLERAVREGRAEAELNFRGQGETRRTFLVRSTCLSMGGKNWLLCVGIDITDRIRLEGQLRQAQKMETVGQLAGGVAHDFNNMLQAISGFTQMARQPGLAEADRMGFLGEVLAASGKAAELTRQLLAYGRRQSLQMQPADLAYLVRDHLKFLQRLIGDHVQIDFQPPAGRVGVRCDPTQLEQVLMNLCVNSRDAMPKGGKIVIRVEETNLDAAFCEVHGWARPGRYARLTVTDSGCGMSKAMLKHIFEPFFTTKRKHEGTGLGLAVVYGIIQQHRGMIQVYSEVNVGTTFHIYLPGDDQGGETRGELAEEFKAAGGVETILVAEDEPMVRNLTELILKNAGYRVILAENGREAVDLFNRHKDEVDLLIFDAIMPEMGGVDAYRMVREGGADLPVIFSSGYSEAFAMQEHPLPANGILIQKPYRPEELLRRIRQVLEG